MGNYIKLFDKFIDVINWDVLKKSTFTLKTDYYTARNHLIALIYFQLAKLDSLRDLHAFMKSDSDLISVDEVLDITYSEIKLLDKETKIIYDKTVYLGNKYVNKTSKKYRIMKIIDSKGKELVFLTNILYLSSEEIAWLYKKRWEIELFFKWIKQNLKIKRFIGHSFNAVMIQIITAIITFIMLKLVKEKAKTAYGLLDIRRLLKYRITTLINKENFTWELLFSG